MVDRNASPLREQVEDAIRGFPFDNYGLDDVSYLLGSEPDTQGWVPALADAVLAAIRQDARTSADGGES